ncbi:MAG: HIT family protein [Planctomycetes bacterium]|nr:HIT family protein [Planctomycetota bacterium]
MTAAPDCVFCKIVAGKIPSHTVLRDDSCMAFLDVGPLADGHLLLIPLDHYERLDEVPAEVTAAVARRLPELGRALVQATGAEGYNVLQNNGVLAGQAVPHVHFHLIPRRDADGLGYRWHPKSYPTGRAEEICTQLAKALAG